MKRLWKRIDDLLDLCRRMGLDFFDIQFEVVPFDVMTEVAAYGLPIRGQHWSYGKVFNRQRLHGRMGLSKIFEIVINSDPAYAFLLDTNREIENLMIAAHVAGHVDFFKHNALFAPTHRRMVDEAAQHAARLDQYKERYGLDPVERLMDIGFALERHIDTHKGVYRAPYPERRVVQTERKEAPYADLHEEPTLSVVERVTGDRLPPHPERDLLWFLIHYAPLAPWEQDVLSIIREESHYFYPQFATKILNEGWASYWHAEVLQEYADLSPAEAIEYAQLNSMVIAPGPRLSVNPYYLGLRILRAIEQRFGREHLFRVRSEEDDFSLIRNYLTAELCEELQLFRYGRRCRQHRPPDPHCVHCRELVIVSRDVDEVREGLLQARYHYGVPQVVIDRVEGGTLCLEQLDRSERALDPEHAKKTVEYIYDLWRAPVRLITTFPGTQSEIELLHNEHGLKQTTRPRTQRQG